jgi:hypothetical protein
MRHAPRKFSHALLGLTELAWDGLTLMGHPLVHLCDLEEWGSWFVNSCKVLWEAQEVAL